MSCPELSFVIFIAKLWYWPKVAAHKSFFFHRVLMYILVQYISVVVKEQAAPLLRYTLAL